jgi:hypothetical protein
MHSRMWLAFTRPPRFHTSFAVSTRSGSFAASARLSASVAIIVLGIRNVPESPNVFYFNRAPTVASICRSLLFGTTFEV